MPDAPSKIFDLMDTETEPTDEQLEQLMQYVIEAVIARKALARKKFQENFEATVAEVLRDQQQLEIPGEKT